jgi:hypothetical protein
MWVAWGLKMVHCCIVHYRGIVPRFHHRYVFQYAVLNQCEVGALRRVVMGLSEVLRASELGSTLWTDVAVGDSRDEAIEMVKENMLMDHIWLNWHTDIYDSLCEQTFEKREIDVRSFFTDASYFITPANEAQISSLWDDVKNYHETKNEFALQRTGLAYIPGLHGSSGSYY